LHILDLHVCLGIAAFWCVCLGIAVFWHFAFVWVLLHLALLHFGISAFVSEFGCLLTVICLCFVDKLADYYTKAIIEIPHSTPKIFHNPPTEVTHQCRLLASSSSIEDKHLPVDTNAHIIVVLGKIDSYNSKVSLLALHYLDSKYNLFPQPMSNSQKLALFHDLLKLCPREGFEVCHFGGSSGLAKTSDELFEFLHVPGNLPKRLVVAKILKCHSKYKIVYVPNENKKKQAMSVNHSNPVYGGAFKLKGNLINKYKFLVTFTKLKAAAAELLHVINNECWTMTGEPLIQPEAIENERELFRGHLEATVRATLQIPGPPP
jgi:hypothetical protein